MTHCVVVYTKEGCHLCEDALAVLRQLCDEFQLTIVEIDITTDDALFKRYYDEIPVLVIDNRTLLAAPIRELDVRAALDYISEKT